ncbi:MAG: biotin/lipoyl-binding protein [Anaerolineae bacterium]
MDVTVSAVSRIRSDRSARLSFSAPGQVTEILVEQGDDFAEGGPLARLDDTAQQTALEQAQLGLQLAQLQKDR